VPGLRPPTPLQRQRPARRSRRPGPTHQRGRRRFSWRTRLILAAIVLIVGVTAWAAIARATAPASNTALGRFDAIIVLGYPADSDGNPTPQQLARVTEAVHEYERGVAPRLILTGGAAHNNFVEANVMARTAEADGIPSSAIYKEPQAQDTIQNACFAVRIMNQHGWRSAEVISSTYHLPRAALIFSRTPIEWRTHAAPTMEPESLGLSTAITAVETLKTARYLLYTSWADRCQP
jgi:uncharacterized SAM-binding protein YcdF (DUF218 family)